MCLLFFASQGTLTHNYCTPPLVIPPLMGGTSDFDKKKACKYEAPKKILLQVICELLQV